MQGILAGIAEALFVYIKVKMQITTLFATHFKVGGSSPQINKVVYDNSIVQKTQSDWINYK